MDDVELVVAALGGDSDAYAAIYDRYADRIHDFCDSILRYPEDAAGATDETFAVAFETIDELADPGSLREWLYAIAHRIILNQLGGDSVGGHVPAWDGGGPVRRSRAELAEFVWQVAASLPLHQRIMLDLAVRQGLEGRDLAAAAGMAASQLDRQLDKLESEFDRTIGALLVARTASRTCPDLHGILEGWDGRLTPEIREEITRHVDDCERCNSRRRILPSAIELLAEMPLAPAPAFLRDRVLDVGDTEAGMRRGDLPREPPSFSVGWAFDQRGFPDLRDEAAQRRPLPGQRSPGADWEVGREDDDWGTGAEAGAAAAGAGAGVFGGGAGVFGTAAGPGAGARVFGAAAEAGRWGGSDPQARTPPAGTRVIGSSPVGPPPGAGAPRAPTRFIPPGPPPGPPLEDPAAEGHDPRGALIGVLAGIIVLIAATLFLIHQGGGSHPTVGVTASTTGATDVSTSTSSTSSTLAPLSVPATIATTTTVVTVGQLTISTGNATETINLGVATTSASFTVGNTGQASLDFTAAATGTGLTVNPASGTLFPGASQVVTVSLDRTQSPPGPFSGSVVVTSPTGTTTATSTVKVTAVIDPGPTIANAVATPPTVYYTTPLCPKLPKKDKTTSVISATVSGPQPVTEVVLHWVPSSGGIGGTSIMSANGSTYTGTLGPYTSAQTIGWWISAIDNADATVASQSQALTVMAC